MAASKRPGRFGMSGTEFIYGWRTKGVQYAIQVAVENHRLSHSERRKVATELECISLAMCIMTTAT